MADRASIKDVAAAAGVSYKTVSRVVNSVATVDPAIRARVEAAISELHYVPNATARALKTGSPSTVGVLVDSIDDVFFSAVVSAIEDQALAHGLGVVVASTGHDPEREREQLLRLIGQHVLGVVLSPSGGPLDYFSPYRATVPVVAVDRPAEGYDAVLVDDFSAARDVVTLLISSGHRRIGLLGWDPSYVTAARRRAGYEAALAQEGIAFDGELVPPVMSATPAAVMALRTLLSLHEAPSALFVSNARHAAAVVAELHRLDRTDVALVSFGDFLLAETVRPSVTCVDQDPYEIGSVALERLLSLATQGSSAPVARLLPTQLLIRQSHLVGVAAGGGGGL